MTLIDLIKEELDTKRLKFEIEQMLSHIENQEKRSMNLEAENKKMKEERARIAALQKQNRISTDIRLKKKTPNPITGKNGGISNGTNTNTTQNT